jgi:hypothetical protein
MTAPASQSPTEELRLVALESEPAPAEIGGIYSKIESASLGDRGTIAFSAQVTDGTVGSALILDTGDSPRVLLRAGDRAPSGDRYETFRELDVSEYARGPAMGEHPLVLFRAELEGGSAAEGLFLWGPGGVKTIALPGDKSPRGDRYRSFSQLTVLAGVSNEGVVPIIAFVAHLEDGRKTLIVDKHFQEPLELLAAGDVLGEDEVKDFAVSRMGGLALCCVADLRNRQSGKRFREALILVADTVFSGNLEDQTSFQDLGAVKHILTPPAIRFQYGCTALEFENGVSALATLGTLQAPRLLAKTGDPAPDLSGESIQSFGRPEANSDFPFACRTIAICSTVQLSGGRSALWRYFCLPGGAGQPDQIETRLLLIEDEPFGAPHGPRLRSFTPVKVNNDGAVLVRGAVDDGSGVWTGIFVIGPCFTASSL